MKKIQTFLQEKLRVEIEKIIYNLYISMTINSTNMINRKPFPEAIVKPSVVKLLLCDIRNTASLATRE